MPTVLHLLSQQPLLTGSGVTLDALVREADTRGWQQHAVVGMPGGSACRVAELPDARIHPLEFGTGSNPLVLPGMSDVMPYPSTVFSSMDDAVWAGYCERWIAHLAPVIERVRPDVIHSHHVWCMSGLVKDLAPDVPVVTHCHATGLRQMELCPNRAEEVRAAVSRNDRFVVLHSGHRDALVARLGVAATRVSVVGAGYRDEVFFGGSTGDRGATIAYVGKISGAKGVRELSEAFGRVRAAIPDATLHVAGSGDGAETEALRSLLEAYGDGVTLYGHVAPEQLAAILHKCAVCVLPSYYEGLPLVLVEAAASGCRLVATALPGVVEQIAPVLGEALKLVPMPGMIGPDTPEASARPGFVGDLTSALIASLSEAPREIDVEALRAFRWSAVFERIERVWYEVLDAGTSQQPGSMS